MQFQHGTVPQQPLLRLSKRPRAGIVRCHVRCHVRCRQHRTCALISCSLCCCRRGIQTPNSPQPQASTISRHKIRIRTGSSIYAQYFQYTKLSRRPRRSARASFKLTGSKHTKGKGRPRPFLRRPGGWRPRNAVTPSWTPCCAAAGRLTRAKTRARLLAFTRCSCRTG